MTKKRIIVLLAAICIVIALIICIKPLIITYNKRVYDRESVTLLRGNSGISDEKNGIFRIDWEDGSWLVTRFQEECCGDNCETHLIKIPSGEIYWVDTHYCGVEGMSEIQRNHKNLKEYLAELRSKNKMIEQK